MTTRRDPFSNMDRFFEQFARNMGMAPWTGRDNWSELDYGQEYQDGYDSGIRMERVEDAYRVLADLPGFDREEIDLRFRDGTLSISAVHEASDETTTRHREARERVTVPGEINVETIEASYRNGVLEVTLPLIDADDEGSIHIDVE